MKREIVISIIILIVVVVGNIVTQNYTKECVSKINGGLVELKQVIEGKEKKHIERNLEILHNNWSDMQEKLAFYIEHDELEKVETQLSILKGNIEVELYEETFSEIEKCIFILEHIKEKTTLNIKNIF